MKTLLVQFSEYTFWANRAILDTINQLPGELHQQEVASSFNSLEKTVLHMLDAESIWWQRLKLQERISRPSDTFKGSMKELSDQLLQSNRQWTEWINGVQEHVLQHVFQYHNSKKEQFKQPIYQMLLHLFNHNTYHRGQIVTMLRELKADK